MDFVAYPTGGQIPQDDWLVLLFTAGVILCSNWYTEAIWRYAFFLASMLTVNLWLVWKTCDGSRK